MKSTYIRLFVCLHKVSMLGALLLLLSCNEELPGVGSIPDKTPPKADFSFSTNDADYKEVSFTNLSLSASGYSWDFGDGNTSTEKDPTHIYQAEGSYEVKLLASDKNNVQSELSQTVAVIEPDEPFTPVILNPSFDEIGEDEYRDHWRNENLGGVLQITSSPVHTLEKAAKFPSAGDRIAYQLITVEANKDYIVSFYYTMKTSPEGSLTVKILAGDVTDPAVIDDVTLATKTLTDQSNAEAYVLDAVEFNSGDNTEVAIFVSNANVECRIDSFTIVEN